MSRTTRNNPSWKWLRTPRNVGYRRALLSNDPEHNPTNREKSVRSRTVDSWDDIHVSAYGELPSCKDLQQAGFQHLGRDEEQILFDNLWDLYER